MGGVLSSPSSKKAEKKAKRAERKAKRIIKAAEDSAQKEAEEERRKDIARAYRGRLGTVATSMTGISEKNGDLKRKNLLGE